MMMLNKDSGLSSPLLRVLLYLTKGSWWFSLFLWIILVVPVQAATELRVAIKKNVSQVQVGSSTSALVKDGAGKVLGSIEAMDALSAQSSKGGVSFKQWNSSQITIEPSAGGFVWIGDRWYRGRVRLINTGKGVMAINHIDMESYLYSVVGAEAIATWPLEALKAQAVAARTYAIYKSSVSGNRFYDLDTTTATQVYKGLDTEFYSTLQAVDATKGQVMTYNGKAILAAFHSSSGGHTENVEDVWSSPLPYLRGVVDYDQLSPVFQWTKSFSSNQLSRLIGGVGTIKTMIPEKTTPHGRVVTMRIVGTAGTKRISGTDLRKALDLRSTLFSVSASNGSFQINGRGFGHGLGLSQWGSEYLAQQGLNYDQILTHYYQNASITQIN